MPVGEINQNLTIRFVGKTINGITYGPSESAAKRVLFVKKDFSASLTSCSSLNNSVRIYELPTSTNGMPLTGGIWLPLSSNILPNSNNIGGITYLNSFDISDNVTNIDNVVVINNRRYFSRFQRVVLNNDPAQGLRLIVERACTRTDTTIIGVSEDIKLRYSLPAQNGIFVPVTVTLQRNF